MPVSDDIEKHILRQVQKQQSWQVKLRRHIHQHPEVSFEEHATTAFLKDHIRKMGLKIRPVKCRTGFLAELKGNGPGQVVAIRADIDALPITEQTTLPFKSRNEGCMHACGHDMHMAVIAGTAKVLAGMRNSFPGTVRFIFQPGEEQPPGGAQPMIDSGAVEDAAMVFGLHVDPILPVGRISVRDGATMAAVIDFDLIIRGKTGHAARPHDAVDAIVAAAEVVESLQKIISREISPGTQAVITFGKVHGGTARNVIAGEVRLFGTARTLSDTLRRKLPPAIRRTAQAVCRAHGARAEMVMVADYPVLVNHKKANDILTANFDCLYGKGKVAETKVTMGGEDFARYLKLVPGAMFRLGVRNRKIGADKPWHAADFIADEAALLPGTALLTAAAIDVLTGAG
jgi:amidohydrolase